MTDHVINNELEAEAPQASLTALVSVSRFLAIACLFAMLISVNIEVIGRSFFGQATIWVTEVSTYLVIAITFLGAAFVVGRDANVRVDMVVNALPKRFLPDIMRGQAWLAAFVTLLILWKAAGFWFENYASDTRSWSLLNTPLWMPQTSVVIGMAALSLVLAVVGTVRNHAVCLILAALPVVLVICLATELVHLPLSQGQLVLVFACIMLAGAFIGSGLGSFLVALGTGAALFLAFYVTATLGLSAKSIALIVMLFALLLSGLPVVFCLMALGVAAMLIWLPPVTLNFSGERAWDATNTFELTAIPMFVLMGSILVRSNASTEMFAAARYWMGRVRGGLAYASILASGVFAAVSGSSLATAATMGRVAGPEMMDEGYKPQLAFGVLAAGGTLGILIPPSIAMIIYGPLAGVPVTQLFVAGIIPGLMMIAAFALVTFIWATIDKSAAPEGQKYPLWERIRALKGVIPFLVLMGMVLGSLYAGIATPTEAGAVGVLGAIIISLFRGTLNFQELMGACEEAAIATSFLLMIAVGAAVMSFAVDYLQMPQALVRYLGGLNLSDIWLFVAIVILYFILGMFVEPISMVLITLPIILPVINAAGWDPLWFGIILVMLVEIGLITPPIGMILYVLAGVSEKRATLGEIATGALPFVLIYLVMVFFFFAFPAFVTVLVE
ncbi:TRAP transporter large permease subunit [Pacificoceanicola onchidii]|uniref:TRAP transporter large permease n=1 Tax=Pacificoceanicola onchidii TaxID=2562685 RepID=UPI0010A69AB6|nr:TRAP transporter large permease subunit [Pacificoceanicola onchidii]